MFQGEYASKMDEKGRVSIPVRFRSELGDEFVMAKGADGCLEIYHKASWEAYVEKLLQGNTSSKTIRLIKRKIIGPSLTATLDKQGRVLVGQSLKTYAGLDKDVLFVGVSDRIEVWDQSTYETFDDAAMSLSDLLESADITL